MNNLMKLNKYIIIYVLFFTKTISANNNLDVHYLHNSTANDNDAYILNFKCPSGFYYSTHARPNDCTSFITCNNGIATKTYCHPNYYFDTNVLICKEKHKVKCSNMIDLIDLNPKNITFNETVKNDKIYCPEKLMGIFPHPFSNTRYLKCVYGRLYEKSCRSGQVYNLTHKMCEHFVNNTMTILPVESRTYLSQINETVTYLQCPKDIYGNFVHPFDCHRYLSCFRLDKEILKCPSGQIFNFRREICEPESAMNANDHVECKKVKESEEPKAQFSIPLGIYCSSKGTMTYPYPDNWHRYAVCDNGKLKMNWCPKNQVFIPEIRKCVNEEDALDTIT